MEFYDFYSILYFFILEILYLFMGGTSRGDHVRHGGDEDTWKSHKVCKVSGEININEKNFLSY